MEKESTSVRLRKIMEMRNLRQVDILNLTLPYCQKYNVKMNKSDISQYCSGKTEPNQEKLFVLGAALNVNEAWLMGFDVPMERDNYTDQTLMNRDAIIEDIDHILQKDGYNLLYETTADDFFIIRKSHGQTVAGLYDYELLPRYEALRKQGKVTADLLISSETSFFRYIESIGYYISRDESENKLRMEYSDGAIEISKDTLNDIKNRINTFSKATIDSTIMKLHENALRKERIKQEHIAQNLLAAAHRRTDVEYSEEGMKHDLDIMSDENF